MDVSAFARKIWENPLRLEVVAGKRFGGRDDELKLLIRLDPGPEAEVIFMTGKEVKIRNKMEGAEFCLKLLIAIFKTIPVEHKARNSVMTAAQAVRIVRDIKNTGRSTPSEWVVADNKKDPQPAEAAAE